MEVLADAAATALLVSIQLGLPIAILYILALVAYGKEYGPRASRSDTARPCGTDRCGQPPRVICPESEDDEPPGGEARVLRSRPDLPCWHAVNLSLGRIGRGRISGKHLLADPSPR